MWPLILFNAVYLLAGSWYFLQTTNLEFVIYVAVIVAILGGVFSTINRTKFPRWMLWLLSFWGLLHVLGGAVRIGDAVLFAYQVYPFLDLGEDLYILKYDQLVHFYLYGLVAVMAYHLLRNVIGVTEHSKLVFFFSVLASVGVSALNEIMEFLIAVSIEQNGVGGYENAMLDFCFNLAGALVAASLYHYLAKR